MQQTKLKWIALLLISFANIGLQSQKTISVSGGNASGTGGSISYSVGQTVYTTNSGSEGYLTQGVQQPFEILVLTKNKESKGINLEFSAFPNPSTEYVKLKIQNYKSEKLSYELYNANGKLLVSNRIVADETKIVMTKYIRSAYFLKIKDNKLEVKEFKIIKN
jgi:hypothetical protein